MIARSGAILLPSKGSTCAGDLDRKFAPVLMSTSR